MQKFGYHVSVPTDPSATARASQAFGFYGNLERYGLPASVADARKYGFNEPGRTATQIAARQAAFHSWLHSLTSAEMNVLEGPPRAQGPTKLPNGVTIPAGGCLGQAYADIAGGANAQFGQTPLATQIDHQSFV